jgi:hypothetical protein
MRKFRTRTMLYAAVFCALSLLSPLSAYADSVTLTLEGGGAASSNSYLSDYVYPYLFSIDGNTNYMPMMCINHLSNTSIGETWQATIVTPTTDVEKEAIYIYSLAAASGTSQETIVEAQLADWYLFDTFMTIPGEYASGVADILVDAASFVAANSNSPFYSDYEIYDMLAGTLRDADGNLVPDGQNLIMVAQTPELSSLVLLGSGLAFVAFLFYLQKRKGLRNLSAKSLK